MRAFAARWIIAVALTTGVAAGQPGSKGQVKVLTVCEVLGDVARYAGTAVAVVGRMERRVSLTDHSEFLSQDQCSGKIQIWGPGGKGLPKPPRDRPKFEPSVVASKLWSARRSTELGSHLEP